MKPRARIEIKRSKSLLRSERFYWRIRDLGNNEVVGRGTQNYANYQECREIAVRVCSGGYELESLPPLSRGR